MEIHVRPTLAPALSGIAATGDSCTSDVDGFGASGNAGYARNGNACQADVGACTCGSAAAGASCASDSFLAKRGQQWQQALSLLAVTRQTCIRPGAISGSAVISAGEKDQQWLQALGLLDLMQQTRVLLGVISYSAGISAFEKGHVLLGS